MFMTANKIANIVVTRCGECRLIWYQLISIHHGFEFALYDFPSGPAVVWVQQTDEQHMSTAHLTLAPKRLRIDTENAYRD